MGKTPIKKTDESKKNSQAEKNAKVEPKPSSTAFFKQTVKQPSAPKTPQIQKIVKNEEMMVVDEEHQVSAAEPCGSKCIFFNLVCIL